MSTTSVAQGEYLRGAHPVLEYMSVELLIFLYLYIHSPFKTQFSIVHWFVH